MEENSYIELEKEIKFWTDEIKTSSNHEFLYEIAFFKIFIKLEKFFDEMFRIYSTGKTSSKGFRAKRKLSFDDEEHLRNIFIKKNCTYIDYMEIIQNKAEYIFVKNPFDMIFSDDKLNQCLSQMKTLRNFIAHESIESKNRYQKTLLLNGTFTTPSKFLASKKKREHITQFEYYIKSVTEIAEIILDPSKFNSDYL